MRIRLFSDMKFCRLVFVCRNFEGKQFICLEEMSSWTLEVKDNATINLLKPKTYIMYQQLKHSEILCSAHSAFICFVWISEQTAIISLYSINWLVCMTERECVYCAVRTGSLYIILRSAHILYLCVLCGSQNKQRLFPYTALTGRVLRPIRNVFTARYGLNL